MAAGDIVVAQTNTDPEVVSFANMGAARLFMALR